MSTAERATLFIPQHTHARVGVVLAHVAGVEIDGRRLRIRGDRALPVDAGPHEITIYYEPCHHGLLPSGKPRRSIATLRPTLRFDARPGGSYVLGCNPGGGMGLIPPNAHWIDEKLPDGTRRRIVDTIGGADFPQELLEPRPPQPAR